VGAFLASAIAVAGTLLGSATTYMFQRFTAGRAEEFARDERLRQERLAAYSAFAGAITALRQKVIDLWFSQHGDHREPKDVAALQAEADRLGAAADHARFRVQLVAEDSGLVTCAEDAFKPITAIGRAADLSELKEHEDRCQEMISAFIEAARAQVR
jgi:hypothetical protein